MLQQPQLSDDAPWKRRFRAPVFAAPNVARNGKHGIVMGSEAGSYQVYAWDVATGARRQLTQRPEGVRRAVLSPDGQWVYTLEDNKGDETGHWGRTPFQGGGAQDLSPALPPYSSWSFGESGNGGLLGFTAADDHGFHVYTVERGNGRSLGAPRALYESVKSLEGPFLSHDGGVAAVLSTERSEKGQNSLLAFDARTGQAIAELWDGPDTSIEATANAFSPVPGDTRMAATSNRTGTSRPLLWNPRTGERTDLSTAELPGEVFFEDWSADAATLLLSHVHAAVRRLFLYDLATNVLTPVPHAGGAYAATRFLPGGDIVAQWQDATHPSQIIALNAATGEARTLLASSDVPPTQSWRSVSFPGANGEAVQAWLAVPDGAGPFPAILDTHGGPYSVTMESFSARTQMWLDHGFAHLSVNYHGSTTFGKDFQESIIGRVGELEVKDIVAARDWLVENGIADAKRILLTGWSYGGYLTLHALGLHPTLWAGGMAGVPVADWPLCHEDSAETLKGADAGLFGGRLEAKRALYERASPLTYAENVAAPVLIIQGRNDTRCPARQVEVYEARMKELGKSIEVHWFDAGHGSLVVEQTIRHWETMLKFAYKVL